MRRRRVTFTGGPCDGLEADVDPFHVAPMILAAVLVDGEGAERRAVVLTADMRLADFIDAHPAWTRYYQWHDVPDGPAAYRDDPPPELAPRPPAPLR